jgi:hypothetical protein
MFADKTTPVRRFATRWWRGRYWWVLPLLLLVLPAAIVVYFLLATPDFANFEYHVF